MVLNPSDSMTAIQYYNPGDSLAGIGYHGTRKTDTQTHTISGGGRSVGSGVGLYGSPVYHPRDPRS